jgi:ribosomal protein S18 acetylase RimI-like enzyme
MERNELDIRAYQDKDEADVIDLWHRCNLLVPWNNPKSDIRRKARVNPELFLVGVIRHRVVSTAMGGYEGHRGWINYLAVAPDCRRRGFGKRLVLAIEESLKGLGCPKINLQIRAGNAEAIKFYENLGYSCDDVISMGKRLEKDPEYKI